MSGFFTSEQCLTLQCEYNSIAVTYGTLVAKCIQFSQAYPESAEHTCHGFVRRLGILKRWIQNVYSLYPPARSDNPCRDTLLDLSVNLQSFVVNVYGCLDNLGVDPS